MYLPCMRPDLDDEGLETPRHIGHWVDQLDLLWNRVRLRQSELTNPRAMSLPILLFTIYFFALAERIPMYVEALRLGLMKLYLKKKKKTKSAGEAPSTPMRASSGLLLLWSG